VSPIAFASIYCALREVHRGFESCEKAVEERDNLILQLFVIPILDPLRSHPRYQALLLKMNLEP
jgi:hypothetical protein